MKINTRTLQSKKFNLINKKNTVNNEPGDTFVLGQKPDDIGIMRKSLSGMKSSYCNSEQMSLGMIGGAASGTLGVISANLLMSGRPGEVVLALALAGANVLSAGEMEATDINGSFAKGAAAAAALTVGSGVISTLATSSGSQALALAGLVAVPIGAMLAGGAISYHLAKEKS